MEWSDLLVIVQVLATLGVTVSLFATRETRTLRKLKLYVDVHGAMVEGPGKARVGEVIDELVLNSWPVPSCSPMQASDDEPSDLTRNERRDHFIAGLLLLAGGVAELVTVVGVVVFDMGVNTAALVTVGAVTAIGTGFTFAASTDAAIRQRRLVEKARRRSRPDGAA
ncbi:MAG TPA: hypothetical protein VNS46_06780 [Nocardioides sp.]|nr:hypothetical protein [Nocardioides sp.]